MKEASEELKLILREAMKAGKEILARKYTEQGHKLTGSLVNSIKYSVRRKGKVVVGRLTLLKYGIYLNNGVSASRIPYGGSRGRSGGGTSQYIQGLIRFWRLRGLSDKEAKRAAFATAKKHSQEGMPTKASKRFSSTGKRTGALDEATVELERLIEEKIQKQLNKTVAGIVTNFFTGGSKHVKYTTK